MQLPRKWRHILLWAFCPNVFIISLFIHFKTDNCVFYDMLEAETSFSLPFSKYSSKKFCKKVLNSSEAGLALTLSVLNVILWKFSSLFFVNFLILEYAIHLIRRNLTVIINGN